MLLLDVYAKDEADDLTSEERRELAALAQQYRAEVLARLREERQQGDGESKTSSL